jgi:hypothetical protein
MRGSWKPLTAKVDACIEKLKSGSSPALALYATVKQKLLFNSGSIRNEKGTVRGKNKGKGKGA